MSTYTCEFCGEELNFRVIGGATVPLHPAGSNCEGKKYYRTENLNRCYRTNCPECKAQVFFVRHNGGSVWFDSLGWPWVRHPCFDKPQHNLPPFWKRLGEIHHGQLCQMWFYGILSGEDGGAFLISFGPLEHKPYLRGAALTRFMCPQHYRNKLMLLDGKMAICTEEGVVTLDGTLLKTDGPYKSSLNWW